MNLDQPLCCLNRKPLRLITCERTPKLPKFKGIRIGAQRAQRHGQTTPQQQTVKIQREGMPQEVRASPNPPDNQTQRPPSNHRLTHTTPRTRARRGEEEEEARGHVFTHGDLGHVQHAKSLVKQQSMQLQQPTNMHVHLTTRSELPNYQKTKNLN